MKGDHLLKFSIYNTLQAHRREKEIDFVLRLKVNHLLNSRLVSVMKNILKENGGGG